MEEKEPPRLVGVTIHVQPNGKWRLQRLREENGETFVCNDLYDAFSTVLAAYHPDGSPKAYKSGPVSQEEKDEKRADSEEPTHEFGEAFYEAWLRVESILAESKKALAKRAAASPA